VRRCGWVTAEARGKGALQLRRDQGTKPTPNAARRCALILAPSFLRPHPCALPHPAPRRVFAPPGYPLVDAAMRQLWSTGWCHNRVRVVASSFMVKNLLLPWQWGLKHLWDCQIDADLEADALGW
jgi:hypothetical protein